MRFQFWRSIGVRIIARVPNNVFCCLSPFTVGAGIAWSVYRLPYALGIRTVMFDSWQRQKNYLYCEEFRPALEPIQLLFNFLFHGSLAPTGPTAPHYWGFTISPSWPHHARLDSSGRVFCPMQKPLPDHTQHSQEKYSMFGAGFEPEILASKRPQTHALDHGATGIGSPT
jgi:hypothetical protein